jgi:hypothetical protein
VVANETTTLSTFNRPEDTVNNLVAEDIFTSVPVIPFRLIILAAKEK